MGFFSDNKTLICLSIIGILAISGFFVYWFYVRSQEKVVPNEAPEPVRITPAGTSYIPQAQIKTLPRPRPGGAAGEEKNKRISAVDAVRRRTEPEEEDPEEEDLMDTFFSKSGFSESTEYEREDE